jgi:hypothetical protein
MGILRAINSAVVDLFHLVFAPVRDGQDRETASDFPMWARAAMGWAFILLFFAGFTLLR